jgi:hypothetical protein
MSPTKHGNRRTALVLLAIAAAFFVSVFAQAWLVR